MLARRKWIEEAPLFLSLILSLSSCVFDRPSAPASVAQVKAPDSIPPDPESPSDQGVSTQLDPTTTPTPIPTPTVTSVTPSSGRAGTLITLTGSGFQNGAVVTVGDLSCENVRVVGPTQITCNVRNQLAGKLEVVVTNPDRKSTKLSSGFEYLLNVYVQNLQANEVWYGKLDPRAKTYSPLGKFPALPYPQNQIGRAARVANRLLYNLGTSIQAVELDELTGGPKKAATASNGATAINTNGSYSPWNATAVFAGPIFSDPIGRFPFALHTFWSQQCNGPPYAGGNGCRGTLLSSQTGHLILPLAIDATTLVTTFPPGRATTTTETKNMVAPNAGGFFSTTAYTQNGITPTNLYISPDGKFLYSARNPLDIFQVDPNSHALTLSRTINLPLRQVAGTQDGELVFGDVVQSDGSFLIYGYERNPMTGELRSVPGNAARLPQNGGYSYRLVVAPAKNRIYAVGYMSFHQLELAPDGSLSSSANPPQSFPAFSQRDVDPSGQLFLVCVPGSGILMHTIDPKTGAVLNVTVPAELPTVPGNLLVY